MYLIEGPENGFKSIPQSIYWCIVTLTTVGFGDITPQTPIGQMLATVIMIIGYGIIAVPTGIVSAEYTAQNKPIQEPEKPIIDLNTQSSPNCSASKHKDNTSGHQGVNYDKRRNTWFASWYDENMKQKYKHFSVKKLADELAKELAIDYRKQMAEANGYLNV